MSSGRRPLTTIVDWATVMRIVFAAGILLSFPDLTRHFFSSLAETLDSIVESHTERLDNVVEAVLQH